MPHLVKTSNDNELPSPRQSVCPTMLVCSTTIVQILPIHSEQLTQHTKWSHRCGVGESLLTIGHSFLSIICQELCMNITETLLIYTSCFRQSISNYIFLFMHLFFLSPPPPPPPPKKKMNSNIISFISQTFF